MSTRPQPPNSDDQGRGQPRASDEPPAKPPETPLPVRRGRDVLAELRDSFTIKR